MKTMTLTASSYADLRPFEMMAKRFGLLVGFANEESAALKKFRRLSSESRMAAQKAGLVPDDISAAIKAVRGRKKHAYCN